MASIQYKMVYGLFKLLGVNKILDKEGVEFDKLLKTYSKKQKKPLAIPYKKMEGFDIETKTIGDTTVYVVKEKEKAPSKGVLYLFGGGYILPPDPGDIVLCGQIAKECDAEVWFPLYPMAPEHKLIDTVQSTVMVYESMLSKYDRSNVRFFGTSSGGGLAMSVCMYIKHEELSMPLPEKLVLQSPGLQVPPSKEQKDEMNLIKKDDVMIPPDFFDRIAPVLAKGEEEYLLSPLLFDISGFPSIDIFYGTKEVMYVYLKYMRKHCKKYSVVLNEHVGEGMMHCWGAMEFVPEAKAVRQEYFAALR